MEKCAAIIVRDRQLLVVRKRGTSIFISPGGKIEPGETQIQCLERELREEIGVDLLRATFFGRFVRPSALEHSSITIHAWLTDVRGHCTPRMEIDELRWITGSSTVELGSVFRDCVLPDLVTQDVIDA